MYHQQTIDGLGASAIAMRAGSARGIPVGPQPTRNARNRQAWIWAGTPQIARQNATSPASPSAFKNESICTRPHGIKGLARIGRNTNALRAPGE
jgi:hypothetical protein